jgi:hypothetical protein
MPYPDISTEHLQDVMRRWLNREVSEYFRDIGVDDNWDPDLTAPRQSLAAACRHQDDDPLLLTFLRAWFFEYVKSQPYRVPYHGVPVGSFQESRRFQPQISLYFREDLEDVEPGYRPVEGEISFRLMGYTSETITPTIATTLGTRIKSALGAGGTGYIWRKGKDMATYNEWGKGYAFQLLTRSKAEAQALIENVLDIQQDTPRWKCLNYSENSAPTEAFPTIPETDYIFGESRRTARKRPIADVRFQYALLHVHGVASPVVLYDRSYTYGTALVTAS